MMMTNETKESKKMEKSASLRKSYAKKFHRLRITNDSDFFFFFSFRLAVKKLVSQRLINLLAKSCSLGIKVEFLTKMF